MAGGTTTAPARRNATARQRQPEWACHIGDRDSFAERSHQQFPPGRNRARRPLRLLSDGPRGDRGRGSTRSPRSPNPLGGDLLLIFVGSVDSTILEVATGEGRAVVTNNIKDFRPLAAERLAKGQTHGGLILVPSTWTRSRAAVTALAGAIEKVLHDHPDGLAGSERWIGPLLGR